jgi:hypothetical protein
MESRRRMTVDLSQLTLDELKVLISKAQEVLATRQFEDGLSQAIHEYKARDPRIIRF